MLESIQYDMNASNPASKFVKWTFAPIAPWISWPQTFQILLRESQTYASTGEETKSVWSKVKFCKELTAQETQ